MDNKLIRKFGLFVFVLMLIWGTAVSSLAKAVVPDADILQTYLITKGLFAVLLLAVMSKVGGLKFYGVESGTGWWFLIPALPILLLTVAVFFAPNAPFGLGLTTTTGWILVALFVGIGEESVFRGILWRAFESSGMVITALATSALFGAVHLLGLLTDLPWQIVTSQAVFAFGVGMMFAAVRLASGTLLAPIVLHTVFDAAAIVAAGGVREMFDNTMTVERLLIPGAIFAAWGLVCILFIKFRHPNHSPADPPGEVAVDLSGLKQQVKNPK